MGSNAERGRRARAGNVDVCRRAATRTSRRVLRANGGLAGAALGTVLALTALPAAADPATPFPVRNLNPLTAIFGLPVWRALEPGTELALTTELANHYRFSLRGGQRLILDGETWRTNLALGHTFRERWRVGVELPYYQQSGGVLDNMIDAWHSAFGMPDGGHNARPEGAIEYALADTGGVFFMLDERRRGIGDAQLSVAREIGGDRALTVQASVKLPTGDEDVLAGSGGTDWSLTLFRAARATARSRPAGWFWGVGLLGLGVPDRIEFDTRRTAVVGVVGGGWQLARRLGLKAQLDVHGALYDSPLEEIGDTAIQATFGGWVQLGERGVLDLAVVEDIAVSTAPDVVLHATLRWAW